MSMGSKKNTSTSHSSARQRVYLPPSVREHVNELPDRLKDLSLIPYEAFKDTRFADFVGDQLDAFQGVRDLQGLTDPMLAAALSAAQTGATGISLDAIKKFSNPYMQDVIDVSKRESIKDYNKALNRIQDQEIYTDAFGGDRSGISRANLSENLHDNLNTMQTQGLAQAWDRGLAAAAQDAGLRQQGSANLVNVANASQNQKLQQLAMLQQTGGQQQALGQAHHDFDYAQFLEERADPFNKAQFYTSNLFPLVDLVKGANTSSTQTQTQKSSSSMSPLGAALSIGSMALGGGLPGMGMGMNALGGGGLGSLLSSGSAALNYGGTLGQMGAMTKIGQHIPQFSQGLNTYGGLLKLSGGGLATKAGTNISTPVLNLLDALFGSPVTPKKKPMSIEQIEDRLQAIDEQIPLIQNPPIPKKKPMSIEQIEDRLQAIDEQIPLHLQKSDFKIPSDFVSLIEQVKAFRKANPKFGPEEDRKSLLDKYDKAVPLLEKMESLGDTKFNKDAQNLLLEGLETALYGIDQAKKDVNPVVRNLQNALDYVTAPESVYEANKVGRVSEKEKLAAMIMEGREKPSEAQIAAREEIPFEEQALGPLITNLNTELETQGLTPIVDVVPENVTVGGASSQATPSQQQELIQTLLGGAQQQQQQQQSQRDPREETLSRWAGIAQLLQTPADSHIGQAVGAGIQGYVDSEKEYKGAEIKARQNEIDSAIDIMNAKTNKTNSEIAADRAAMARELHPFEQEKIKAQTAKAEAEARMRQAISPEVQLLMEQYLNTPEGYTASTEETVQKFIEIQNSFSQQQQQPPSAQQPSLNNYTMEELLRLREEAPE